ncbi:MAG: aminodeoxychorismate/anthranilate synthase component II [Cytophagales bacterium]|nr:aminodeoxychorismate/anthranilate synthase component II [Cytophagales bacterium]
MILLLDNFDSFTYNLVDYFHQLGIECTVVRNNISLTSIVQLEISALVISPGPCTPARSGNLMQVLDHYHDKVPILGICLGHQAIAHYFGGKVVKALRPMHGKLSRVCIEEDPLFRQIPSTFEVARYNSLVVELDNKRVRPIAWSDEREVMALKHSSLPIWGVQFHPEAILTEYGLDLLKNWLYCNNLTG